MVLEELTGMMNLIMSPITAFPPYIALFIFSLVITLLILGLNRIFTRKSALKEIKIKMQELRENLTKAQKEGNKENTEKYMSEMLKANNQMMKVSFKSMIISFVIIAIFLPWVSSKYSGATVAYLPFEIPFVGSGLSWVYWYFLVSMTIGWITNKLFGS